MLKIEINLTLEEKKVNGKKAVVCRGQNNYSGKASLEELVAIGTTLDNSLKPILDLVKEQGGTEALKELACGLNESLMSMVEE